MTFTTTQQIRWWYCTSSACETTAKAAEKLQTLTDKTMLWFYRWRLTSNATKNQLLLTYHQTKDNSPAITADGNRITPKQDVKSETRPKRESLMYVFIRTDLHLIRLIRVHCLFLWHAEYCIWLYHVFHC